MQRVIPRPPMSREAFGVVMLKIFCTPISTRHCFHSQGHVRRGSSSSPWQYFDEARLPILILDSQRALTFPQCNNAVLEDCHVASGANRGVLPNDMRLADTPSISLVLTFTTFAVTNHGRGKSSFRRQDLGSAFVFKFRSTGRKMQQVVVRPLVTVPWSHLYLKIRRSEKPLSVGSAATRVGLIKLPIPNFWNER